MIVKSFEIENNIKNISKYKYVLIYGENIGLKEALKNKIKDFYDKAEKINIYQEDITKNKNIILNEVKNVSLFSEEKIVFKTHQNWLLLSKNINSLLFLHTCIHWFYL